MLQSPGQVDWSTTPFYVVGQKTARVLSGDDTILLDSKYRPRILLGAKESGTGAKLAEFILLDYAGRNSAVSAPEKSSDPAWLPLLYLTGDKTTGSLMNTLERDKRIHAITHQVYRTWPRTEFDQDFDRLRDRIATASELRWVYFVSVHRTRILCV